MPTGCCSVGCGTVKADEESEAKQQGGCCLRVEPADDDHAVGSVFLVLMTSN